MWCATAGATGLQSANGNGFPRFLDDRGYLTRNIDCTLGHKHGKHDVRTSNHLGEVGDIYYACDFG